MRGGFCSSRHVVEVLKGTSYYEPFQSTNSAHKTVPFFWWRFIEADKANPNDTYYNNIIPLFSIYIPNIHQENASIRVMKLISYLFKIIIQFICTFFFSFNNTKFCTYHLKGLWIMILRYVTILYKLQDHMLDIFVI